MMPGRNSEMPTRIRALDETMSTRKKELNDLADQKFLEYWFNQDRKLNKPLFDEYLALVRQANAID